MELGLRETKEVGDVLSPEGKQTVIASYWRVSSSHIKKSFRDVREWKVTQDLMFCPSAVVLGSFIKTSMTCSHTGGIEGGSGGVIKVGIDRIPSTTPGAEPPRDAKDSGSARSHSTHLETSSSNRP